MVKGPTLGYLQYISLLVVCIRNIVDAQTKDPVILVPKTQQTAPIDRSVVVTG